MHARRQLKSRTSSLLSELGNSEVRVTLSLDGIGACGVPRDPAHCPVACYLAAALTADERVESISVEPTYAKIALAPPTRFFELGWVEVRLPKPVRDFVADFDCHMYPSLVRTRRAASVPPLRDRDGPRPSTADPVVAR